MLKHTLLLFFVGCFIFSAQAQELNLEVKISAPRLKTADPQVFKTLERSVREFMNETKWTGDEFEAEERIQGNLQITITEDISANTFTADIFIQAIRPVYNSSYATQILNMKESGFTFNYQELQPIQISQTLYYDNLSSVLSYYAYIILGLDYDSFSPFGGEKYFQIAQDVINVLPTEISASDRGWSRKEKRSRTVLLENILSPRARPYREANYSYHRKGLDIMSSDVGKGKAVMMSSLRSVQEVNRSMPNSMIIQLFTDTKRTEIVEIFKASDRNSQTQVYGIMVEIDPAKATSYNDLRY